MEQTSNSQNFTIPIHLHKTTTTLRNPYMMTERDLTSELRFVYSLTSQPSPKSHTLQFCSLSISQRIPLAFDASFNRHSETLQTWNSCSDEDKTCAFSLVFSAISLSHTQFSEINTQLIEQRQFGRSVLPPLVWESMVRTHGYSSAFMKKCLKANSASFRVSFVTIGNGGILEQFIRSRRELLDTIGARHSMSFQQDGDRLPCEARDYTQINNKQQQQSTIMTLTNTCITQANARIDDRVPTGKLQR